jgi:hypothetical protein
MTLCWREPDSNHRFRLRYSPSGSSLVVSADLSTLRSRKTKFAADSALEETGFEPSVPRDTTNLSMSALVGSAPTEKSERKRTDTRSVGPFPRGTGGSNPSSSREESANHRFLGPHACDRRRLPGRSQSRVHARGRGLARGVISGKGVARPPCLMLYSRAPKNCTAATRSVGQSA